MTGQSGKSKYRVIEIAAGFILLLTPIALANQSPDLSAPKQIETSLNNISTRTAKEGSIEGATFTLWKSGGERLIITAKHVGFENKRVGWFYTPLNRRLVLTEISVVFERDHKELVRISADQAEIHVAGGKLIISSGAEITLLGNTKRIDRLTWKLPGNELLLNGAPVNESLVLSIWPSSLQTPRPHFNNLN